MIVWDDVMGGGSSAYFQQTNIWHVKNNLIAFYIL